MLVTNEWLMSHRPSYTVTSQRSIWWGDSYGWTIEDPIAFYVLTIKQITDAIELAGNELENQPPRLTKSAISMKSISGKAPGLELIDLKSRSGVCPALKT